MENLRNAGGGNVGEGAVDLIIEPLRGDEAGVENMDIDGYDILWAADGEEDVDEPFKINIDEMNESDDELVWWQRSLRWFTSSNTQDEGLQTKSSTR